jgi:hypothetical protein
MQSYIIEQIESSQIKSNQINKLNFNISIYLHDQLTEFPNTLSSFLHLSGLWIYNNKLNQFPSQLPSYTVELDLCQDSITSIPSTILSSSTQFEGLDLSENQITILPTQIGLLTLQIESLSITNSHLFLQIWWVNNNNNNNNNKFSLCEHIFNVILLLYSPHISNFLLLWFCFLFQNSLSNLTRLRLSQNNLSFVPNIPLYSIQKSDFDDNPFKFWRNEIDDWNEFFEIHNNLAIDETD